LSNKEFRLPRLAQKWAPKLCPGSWGRCGFEPVDLGFEFFKQTYVNPEVADDFGSFMEGQKPLNFH
jgi:hypothetical protein